MIIRMPDRQRRRAAFSGRMTPPTVRKKYKRMNDAPAIRPNLFIKGAPKCGTTALAHYLAERDDVFFSVRKEPFFLGKSFSRLRKVRFLQGEAAYLALVAKADPDRRRIIAEGSTSHLRSQVAVIGAQLTRFFETVPSERRLVGLQQDLQNEPRAAWLHCIEFPGLPDRGRQSFPQVDAAREHRFKWSAQFTLNPPGPLKRPIHALQQWLKRHRPPAVERLKSALRRKYARPTPGPEFRDRLRETFAGDGRSVQRLLDRDLGHWPCD